MNNKFKKFNTVLFKLAASYVLIAVLSVFLIGILENIIYKSYFNKQIEASNNIILNNLKDFIDKDILEKADMVYLNLVSSDGDMQKYLDINSGNATDYKKIKNVSEILTAQQVLNADWCMNLYIYEGESNTLIGTNGVINNQSGARNQRPEWFDSIISTRNGFSYLPTVSLDSVFSYSQQNGCILVRTMPRRNTSDRDSYLFCEISEEAFAAIMRKTAASDAGSVVLIVDSEGNLISSTDSAEYPCNVKDQEYFRKISEANEERGFFKSRVDGTKSVVSYSSIDRYNWTVVDIMPASTYYHVSQIVGLIVLVVGMLTIFLVLVISDFFARSIYNPMKNIIRKIRVDDGRGGADNEYEIINTAIMNMSGAISNLEEIIKSNRPLIKNNLVQYLIYHKINTQEELDEFLKITGKNISGSCFTAAIMKLDKDIFKNLTVENGSAILYNIIREIESFDSGASSYIAAQIDSESIVIIGSHRSGGRDELMKDAQYFEDYFASNYYISCIMIIGSIVDTPLELYKSFDCAVTAMKYKFLMPKLSVVFGDDIMSREESGAVMPDEYIAEFKKSLNMGSAAGCKKAVHTILNELVEGDYKVSYCNTKTLELAAVISGYMKEHSMKSSDFIDTELTDVFGEIDDIYEFEKWVVNLTERILSYRQTNARDNSEAIVDSIKKYISDNITADLSLNMVAEKVFLSPQYLSKVFKEQTGVNFGEYVTNIRMEKAAELLLRENVSIETIAGMVGYNTPHYFIKKFKERYGVTPKIYRTNHLQ